MSEEKEKKIRRNAKYNIDYVYFNSIDCEHKAYWLGLLLADGYVDDRSVRLCLQENDIDTIRRFKYDLNAEQPIRYNSYNSPEIVVVCKSICDTLKQYGFHHRKSYSFDLTKILEVIPNEYEHHFIRGMFDGDGSIKYYKYDYQKTPFYHFGYTGLKNVCEYVMSKLNIDTIVRERDTDTYTAKTKNPKKIIDIYNYLYRDATIYMKRKYDVFQEIISIESERNIKYSKTGININRDRCRYITYNGETHSIKEWAKIRNINYTTLCGRINSYNWDIGRALEYDK